LSEQSQEKLCFIISPIDEKGTDTRIRSDQIKKHIIDPVVSALGYRTVRADEISEPGMITHQIIDQLLDSELVVADLTSRNANVFYELAIRHAIRKPVVLMIATGEDIPFDVSQSRAIQFNYRDLDSVANCKSELQRQVRSLEENPNGIFSPVSTAIDLRAMRGSGDPSAQRDAQIISMLQSIQANFARVEQRANDPEASQRARASFDEALFDEIHTSEGQVLRVPRAYNFYQTYPLYETGLLPPSVDDEQRQDADNEEGN
jgi:hypothetical protein